MLLYRLQDDTH